MSEDNRIALAKKITCEMFSIPGLKYRPQDLITHFLMELPKTEIPFEQAKLYRELVGIKE